MNTNNNNVLRQLLLTELFETDGTAATIISFIEELMYRNVALDSVIREPEPDVYVNNYFEHFEKVRIDRCVLRVVL
jgi:hypothetical protein